MARRHPVGRHEASGEDSDVTRRGQEDGEIAELPLWFMDKIHASGA